MAVNSVKGTFKGMSGIVNFDPNNLADSKFDVCIDATTINTGNKKEMNILGHPITSIQINILISVLNQPRF